LLRTEPDEAIERGVVPGALAQDAHFALARPKLPCRQLEERALARAVGSEQSGNARGDSQRQLVQADDVAIPLGDAAEVDDRSGGLRNVRCWIGHRSRSMDLTRVERMPVDRTKRPPSTPADHVQGCFTLSGVWSGSGGSAGRGGRFGRARLLPRLNG